MREIDPENIGNPDIGIALTNPVSSKSEVQYRTLRFIIKLCSLCLIKIIVFIEIIVFIDIFRKLLHEICKLACRMSLGWAQKCACTTHVRVASRCGTQVKPRNLGGGGSIKVDCL